MTADDTNLVDSEIGIVMLDNCLPRSLGDVGNPATFAFPITLAVSEGADTEQVVANSAGGLLDSLTATAHALEQQGVRAVTTCCGFLAIYQQEMGAALNVPVATSSLLQIPLVLQLLRPDQIVCVLTADSRTLTELHFDGVGVGSTVSERVEVAGIEHTTHLFPILMGSGARLAAETATEEVLATALAARARWPNIGAFVLECTNLPPYSAAIARATGLPVWDAVTLIRWLQSGVTSVRHVDAHG
jgi:hypothetical protein